MNNPIYLILAVFLLAIVVAWLVYYPVVNYAKRHNIYDNPDARKLQRVPIPVLGGVVVFVGALVATCIACIFYDCSVLIPTGIAMLLMLVVGTWDDIKNLTPQFRLLVEVIVCVALIWVNDYSINDLHGLWGIDMLSPWIAYPLTVLTMVGIINAVNLIDGVDGLSSGICIMACGLYGVELFYSHDYVQAVLAMAACGALIPFFIHNVFGERSKMFIGDGGTLMMGLLLAHFVVAILDHDSLCTEWHPEGSDFGMVPFTLAVLIVPVGDTLRVMLMRMAQGHSPFVADKTHLHHAFINYGFHHLETSLMEILLNVGVVGMWWVMYKSHLNQDWQLYVVAAAGVAIVCGLYYMLGRKDRIAKKVEAENQKREEEQ